MHLIRYIEETFINLFNTASYSMLVHSSVQLSILEEISLVLQHIVELRN